MTNRTRIANANLALTVHHTAIDGKPLDHHDLQTPLADLLADLRHYARHPKLDYAAADDQARLHFDAETPWGLDVQTPA